MGQCCPAWNPDVILDLTGAVLGTLFIECWGSPVYRTITLCLFLSLLAACDDAAPGGESMDADGAIDAKPADQSGANDGDIRDAEEQETLDAGAASDGSALDSNVTDGGAPHLTDGGDGAVELSDGGILEPGEDGGVAGEVIEAPADEWTWIDFPDTHCADGTATGLGVNLHRGATKALVYFEGGGSCWDYGTCTGFMPTAMHLGGYGEAEFFGVVSAVYRNSLLMTRGDIKNPFNDAHMIFVPYCTGDVHAGDAVVELSGLFPWENNTVHFKGGHNVRRYLTRLAPTFEGLEQVFLAGTSAGGFGAAFNWPRFIDALGDIPVHVIDDSGPPLQPEGDRWVQWNQTWNTQFPEDCLNCAADMGSVVDYYRTLLQAGFKMAVASYATDSVVPTFMGIWPAVFEERLGEMCEIFDEEPNAQYFIIPGFGHTLTLLNAGQVEAHNGLPLWRWLEQMVDDDPEWASVRP
jgi:hypothetical protein